jgi:acetylornithine deacetylase/succinyl-diaminopimelate desuccinylase-like protein
MVAAMSAVKILKDLDIELDGDLLIVQAADEMQGGLKGLKVIMEEGLVKANSAIYTECDLPIKVEIAHRGLVQLDITVNGRTAHTTETSAQHGLKPINAIRKMAKVIPAISNMEFTNWRPHKYIPGEPIISPNMIWGGHAENLVADRCTIRCDCRTIPPQTTQTVIDDVTRLLDSLKKEDPDLDYEIELYNEANYSVTEPSELIVRTVQRAFKEVTGNDLPFGGVKTTSDARWLVERGIPTCKFSYISGRSGTNEYIEVEHYLTTVRVYLLCILYLLYDDSIDPEEYWNSLSTHK